MGGGAGCVCGVEAVDEAAEDETEEEGEPTAAADVCSTTAVATGAEATTSSEAEAGAAATAAAAATTGEGEGDSDEEPGSELWDDSLPGILGNEHTSQRVMSSWFWNVQRLQVHCSPAAPAAG